MVISRWDLIVKHSPKANSSYFMAVWKLQPCFPAILLGSALNASINGREDKTPINGREDKTPQLPGLLNESYFQLSTWDFANPNRVLRNSILGL